MTRDFTPLFRTAIGFDRLAQVVDGLQEAASNTFPPYNIEKTGDETYRVSIAVAGFAPDDLDVTVRDNTLIVSGRVRQSAHEKVATLYRGIAGRSCGASPSPITSWSRMQASITGCCMSA
jgi:molecular chaperone IbpA